MRWSLVLQPVRFTLREIKGNENVDADFLSRGTSYCTTLHAADSEVDIRLDVNMCKS